MNKLEEEYFEWLCYKVVDGSSTIKYSMLMSYLYDSIFVPILIMDDNRSEDGKSLRRRFSIDHNIPGKVVSNYFNNRKCSILEMMVALSIRCEETIMTDEQYGDRTGSWFWNMIESLGLDGMNNARFDTNFVDIVLGNFINRHYKRNGEGGLFTIDGIKKDMRKTEIWYQMCWYLEYL